MDAIQLAVALDLMNRGAVQLRGCGQEPLPSRPVEG
jgi:hypothetical protein